jgi:hypothetical protein
MRSTKAHPRKAVAKDPAAEEPLHLRDCAAKKSPTQSHLQPGLLKVLLDTIPDKLRITCSRAITKPSGAGSAGSSIHVIRKAFLGHARMRDSNSALPAEKASPVRRFFTTATRSRATGLIGLSGFLKSGFFRPRTFIGFAYPN